MTDKYIINDVNVCNCEFFLAKERICNIKELYNNPNKEITLTSSLECENNPYCYFKQLKQLQAENLKLKDNVKQIFDESIEKGYLLIESQEENKQLKNILDDKNDFLNKYNNLLAKNKELRKKNKKYKKGLIKIKNTMLGWLEKKVYN